jgi:endonuclease YncB( thermonuclease family)
LAELCFQKRAENRYGRTVARVTCEGRDGNAEQVRTGMAWAYTKYLKDPAIEALEVDARGGHRALWAEPAPVPPRDWRHPPKG